MQLFPVETFVTLQPSLIVIAGAVSLRGSTHAVVMDRPHAGKRKFRHFRLS